MRTVRKRKVNGEHAIDNVTTDTVAYGSAYGSAQWWYNKMSKQYRMPDLNARITYNPSTARIELRIVLPNA